MKRWSGQLHTLILLGLLAALTYWLQALMSEEDRAPGQPSPQRPDAIVSQVEIRRIDEQGRLRYRLEADRLVHYPANDVTELDAPRLITYQRNAPPFSVVASTGRSEAGGATVHLRGDVVLSRAAGNGRPMMTARMAQLTAYPDEGTALTDSPVEITYGRSWLTGVGARIDHNAGTFQILQQARGQHTRPNDRK